MLAGFAVAAFLLLTPVSAQETPEATETQEPAPSGSPLVRIEVDAEVQPVHSGDEFEVRVVVDNVEGLSSFGFHLEYDSDRVEPLRVDEGEIPTEQPDDGLPGQTVDLVAGDIRVMGELGEFLSTGDRGLICAGPMIRRTDPGKVFAVCASPAPPVCLGGAVGVSGSGILAKVVFKSKGGDMTSFSLSSLDLVSDDVDPLCDPEVLTPLVIPHEQSGAVVVMLSGGGGISTLLLVAIAAVVVIVVLVGSAAAFMWYQRRTADAV
ncbi:MAG: hypothetical protein IH866_03940 [Chloroflexi bacterium]|nr:hypothetical protein [Chloroflexota bacterium]